MITLEAFLLTCNSIQYLRGWLREGVCKPAALRLQDVCMIDNHYQINTINHKLDTTYMIIKKNFQQQN